MTREEAITAITKAINEYDEGVITRVALSTVVEETVNEAWNSAYDLGLAVADDEAEDDEIEFEAEFPLDEEDSDWRGDV